MKGEGRRVKAEVRRKKGEGRRGVSGVRILMKKCRVLFFLGSGW
jgi:hypothetical protein